jgi:ABC-2 type transport system ATP-binding protein
VPQELAIYPLLTATENLDVFGRLYGVPAAEIAGRVKWALEWSDLKDRAHEPTKRFSGGMKRRLNIACSLLHQPTLVLLDEPTVGVDPQSRERIYGMLADLQRAGVSIVLTTHHLEEAEQRCERIVIIDHGRIVAAGTLAELLHRVASQTRHARITLARPLAAAITDVEGLTVSEDRATVSVALTDPGRDLVRVISAVTSAGGELANVVLAGATLHDVFIALTGRELADELGLHGRKGEIGRRHRAIVRAGASLHGALMALAKGRPYDSAHGSDDRHANWLGVGRLPGRGTVGPRRDGGRVPGTRRFSRAQGGAQAARSRTVVR